MTHKGNYILWTSTLLEMKDVLRGINVSPPGVRWQTGFVGPLLDSGCTIRCLMRLSDPYWPRGPLISGRNDYNFFRGIDGEVIQFFNFPKLRNSLIRRAYNNSLRHIIKKHGSPGIAVFWNIDMENISLFRRLKRDLAVPCIIIAADVPTRGSITESIFTQSCLEADGVVYLSWSIFEASTAQNKIHLDGGISHVILNKRMTTIPDAEPFLMYTGAFVPYSGIHLLTDAMERTSGNFKLVICGNCRDTGMLARFAGNSRFDYRGFVSEEELESLSRRSFAFVNSYLPSAPECRGKFPSKLYEYISFGRPVISTRTLGIAPEYADVLHYIDGEDPAHFAKEFENVFCFDISARAAQIEKNRHFLEQRTWEHQISRFLEFLSQCGIQTLNCRKDTL